MHLKAISFFALKSLKQTYKLFHKKQTLWLF